MKYNINNALEVLEQTPKTLHSFLGNLSNEWIYSNEGENTWSPFDIIGHLIHGEKTDWIIRLNIILSKSETKTFEPFDRFAQQKDDKSIPIEELLKQFKKLRTENLKELIAFNLSPDKLEKQGIHPDLGKAKLKELLSTWVVHDLGHIAQISRVMAKQYKSEVGPWKKYLGILKK